MTRRRTLICGATLVLFVVPPAIGTASASAGAARSHSVSNRSLALHRTESRWHRRQMKSHDATFRRLNRSVHRRYPFAAPMADRAIHVPHAVHRAMGWGDGAFLGFHERFAGR